MSKTSDRMTSYEKGIYRGGQSLVEEGRKRMEQARQMVKDRQEAAAAQEAARLEENRKQAEAKLARERSAQIIRERNEKFQENIGNLVDDIRRTCAAYHLEHGNWQDVTTEFDLDAPLCKLTLIFRPKV